MSPNKNHFRYQLYMKRAVLQAHLVAIDETIQEIEIETGIGIAPEDDYRMDDEDCFEKYFNLVDEVE